MILEWLLMYFDNFLVKIGKFTQRFTHKLDWVRAVYVCFQYDGYGRFYSMS